MTVMPAPGTAWAFACWLALGLGLCASFPGRAAEPAALRFDIAAQPLDAALAAYTQATGMAVLVDSSLTAGRRASAVQGRYAPQDALGRLLAGTGLQARYTNAMAFTLAEPAPAAAQPGRAPAQVPASYAGVLQRTVTRALCQWRGAEFGRYRATLQLWIGRNGAVSRAALLSGTGDARRDAALAALMTGLVMDAPPPAALPRPVTISLTPRPDPAADCRLAGAAGG